ncbi:MAG TPA: SDR family oxidoreductase, partial [Thermopolyspora sp.]
MIVITGANGRLGRLIVRGLAARIGAEHTIAAVRTPAKAEDLVALGVQVRQADYDRPKTLAEAFAGAEKVLLISGSEVGRRVGQHQAVIDAAKRAGVPHLLYTGILGGPEADFPLAHEHKLTERAILESGLTHTFLRHGWYSENYTENLATVLTNKVIVGNAGEGRVASATRQDFAEAAVAVLSTDGHDNTAYELSGDEAWSLPEYAAEISRQSGTPIAYQDVPAATHKEILLGAGLSEPWADTLVTVDDAIARGLLAR